MINYFYKVTNFDINSKLLYDEWIVVAKKHNVFQRTAEYRPKKGHFLPNYYKVLINFPDNLSEDMDPVWIHRNPYNQGMTAPNWNINSILKDWQGTYTEQVARTVNSFLLQKNPEYKLQVINYAALGPKSRIAPHTDNITEPRFFLSVSAPEGCYMEINNEKHSMSEVGALYRLNLQAVHSPINESNDFRLMMMFDYLK